MKKYKNIVAILMILVLLPATGGISIYHHICSIDGEHNTAIFSKTSCSHKSEDHCNCAETSENAQSQCNLDNHDHCSEFVEYKSIDAKFVAEKSLEIRKNETFSAYVLHNEIFNNSEKQTIIVYPDKSKIPITKYIKFQNFQSRNKSGEESC